MMIAAALTITVLPDSAHAQTTPPPTQVKASPKGAIGLGLVGAELGLAIPAISGLDQWWALTLISVAGGTGGALAGHFAIDKNGNEKVSVAMLVTGLALVVPAVIVTVKGLRYDPTDEAPPEVDPYAERRHRAKALARAGDGLLRKSEYGLHVGPPGFRWTGPAVGERAGVIASGPREYHFSLVSGVF